MRKELLLVAFGLVILWLRWLTTESPSVPPGATVKLTATLNQEPKATGQTQTFTAAGFKVTTWRYPPYHYGQRLVITGQPKDRVLSFPEISVVGQETNFLTVLTQVRRRVESIYRRGLPEPQAGLLAGIVLGSKQDLPKDFYQQLQQTGVLHVVVASGANVAMVSGTLFPFFLWFCRRPIATIVALLSVWLYVFLAGGDIPVLRAGLMASAVLLAQALGREEDGWRSLVFAAWLILLLQPRALTDLGFQLSFLATTGIFYFGPVFKKWLANWPIFLQGEMAQTFGAQLAILPLLLLNFGTYSLWSPVVNLLVVPILPLVMKLGLLVGLVGLIFESAGEILALSLWPVLTYFVEVVEWFGGL